MVAVDPGRVDTALGAAARLAASRNLLADPAAIGIERIDLHDDRLDIHIQETALLGACGAPVGDDHDGTITLSAPVERVRRGHELKLVIPDDASADATVAPRDERLVRLLAEAMEARRIVLGTPDRSLQEIARAQRRCRKRLAKLVRLSWLAPEIIETISMAGSPRH